MKEKIYTIEVNEAVNGKDGCPLCRLYEKLENEFLENILGASMMEVSIRKETNKKGFCKSHLNALYSMQNSLPFALILESHIAEIKNNFAENSFIFTSFTKSLFKKTNLLKNSCYICDKLDYTMDRYFSVLFYLWKKDDDFKNRLLMGDGFCMPHFNNLIELSQKMLSKKEQKEFLQKLISYQKKSLELLFDDIAWFCQKFNYKNQNEPWKNSKDAPKRAVQKLKGGL